MKATSPYARAKKKQRILFIVLLATFLVVATVVGPLIRTEGRDAVSINKELETWIEDQMRRISPERYAVA